MAKMARIVDGVVGDVIVPVEGFTLEQCFHRDLLAQYVNVVEDAEPGWAEADAVIPEPEPAPEPAPEPEVPAEEAPAEETPPAE